MAAERVETRAAGKEAPIAEAVDVVVVGGGVAGIAAALSLAKRSFKVALVESRSILGGRARSWTDGITRDPVHIGPHVVVSEYPNFFHLLSELGTLGKIAWQPRRHFLTWVKGREEHHIRTLPLPAPVSWGLTSATDPFVSMADKHSTVPASVHFLSLSEEDIDALDDQSGAELLRKLGVTEAYIQHFWAFLSHAILNVPIEEVSAAAMVRFFRRLAGRSSMEMGFSDGGLGELLTPAREILTSLGADIIMGTEVCRFLGTDACSGVELDDGRQLQAQLGVISTLPPQTLLALLPSSWVEAHPCIRDLELLKPCKYLSVYLWFDRQVAGGKQMWARTYDKGDLNCEFYDFSQIYSGVDSQGRPWKERPSFIGSNIIDSGRLGELSDDEIVQGTLRELEENFPVAREAKLVHSVVNRVPMAIHRPVVGTERLRPDQASPVPRLFFGGCWTRTLFPSSMESAARGGFLAAEKLLQSHGQSTAVAIPYTEIDLGARLVGKFGEALRPAVVAPFFRALVRLSGGGAPQSKL